MPKAALSKVELERLVDSLGKAYQSELQSQIRASLREMHWDAEREVVVQPLKAAGDDSPPEDFFFPVMYYGTLTNAAYVFPIRRIVFAQDYPFKQCMAEVFGSKDYKCYQYARDKDMPAAETVIGLFKEKEELKSSYFREIKLQAGKLISQKA